MSSCENDKFLSREQRLSLSLKALYKSYGYKEFKLSSFDEYSLYADNQSFIGGKSVISFSVGGKLLALRPDVTLSIIKNGRFAGETEKLFYDEKVYRKSARGGFSEVSQIGVEVIGGVDIAAEAELCTLMLKTLAEVDERFVLDISHMGVVVKTLEALGLKGGDAAFAVQCLEGKNEHDFTRFAREKGLESGKAEAFKSLITLPYESALAIKKLKEISKTVDISEEVEELAALLGFIGEKSVNIDFSIGGDAEYYNGVIFKGYASGVPHAVLTGGRYDKLLSKFDKKEKAMGFALYLGELCKYSEDAPDQPDAVLIYKEENGLSALKKAEKLRAEGLRVLIGKTVPEGFSGKIYYAEKLND